MATLPQPSVLTPRALVDGQPDTFVTLLDRPIDKNLPRSPNKTSHAEGQNQFSAKQNFHHRQMFCTPGPRLKPTHLNLKRTWFFRNKILAVSVLFEAFKVEIAASTAQSYERAFQHICLSIQKTASVVLKAVTQNHTGAAGKGYF